MTPGTIPQRDALIIELRREGMTLEALGRWFNLSKTHIMYICENGPQTKREWQRARRAAIVSALATGRRHELRWKAVIEYRTDNGIVDVEHNFEEVEELHDIIERGPNWNCMERCIITLNRVLTPGLTVENQYAE